MNLTEITDYENYTVEATMTYDLSEGGRTPRGYLEVKIGRNNEASEHLHHQSQGGSVTPDNDYLSGILKHQTEFHSFYIEYKVTSALFNSIKNSATPRHTVSINPKTGYMTGKKIQ